MPRMFLQSLFSSLLFVGCSEPDSPLTTANVLPLTSQSVDGGNQKQLTNKIKSLAEERLEDPSFEVTGDNQKAIDLIRSLAIMQGLEFEESSLGYCDESVSTVVFTRPECEYYVEYREATRFRNPQVSAVIASRVDGIKPAHYPTVKLVLSNLAMIAGLSAESPTISSGTEGHCRKIAEVVNTKNFDELLTQAFAGAVVDAEFDCDGLRMRFVNPLTNNPRLEIWRK